MRKHGPFVLSAFASACARITPVIGQKVSHYRILDRIGSGGMGVVYRAEDLRLRRPVALKFLHPSASADATARERFLREAHCVARLDHPNVCTLYETDTTEDGQMFIAMAYYEGETLAQRLKRALSALTRRSRSGCRSSPGSATRTNSVSTTATSSRPT